MLIHLPPTIAVYIAARISAVGLVIVSERNSTSWIFFISLLINKQISLKQVTAKN